MTRKELGSLTKEPPLRVLDATIQAITPGMTYARLRRLADSDPRMHVDAPGLLRQRFLLLDQEARIQYDEFLSLIETERNFSPRVRKVMYFVWTYRDSRLRRFVTERIADKSGRWRAEQILNKSNAKFFEQWLAPSSARKTRSNFEYFLVEAGLFRPKDQSIHLELRDGWILDGMRVAAQHELSRTRRRSMTHAPAEFLIANGWQGLANATAEELRRLGGDTLAAEEPLEDEGIRLSPTTLSRGRDWRPSRPWSGTRRPTTSTVDWVVRERANAIHQRLEQIMANAARAQGYAPLNNAHIDMFFRTPGGFVLAEMKSCRTQNFHAQVRRGVSQLLEYHYLYGKELGESVTRVLVVETCPTPDKHWLLSYLGDLGITLAWKESRADRLVTTGSIPSPLAGIVHLAVRP